MNDARNQNGGLGTGRDQGGRDEGQRDREEDRPVYEPTRVQSSSERDRDDRAGRDHRDVDDPDRGGRGSSRRPSSDFDDWDTE